MRWLGIGLAFMILTACCLPAIAGQQVSDDEIYDKVRLKLASDRDVRGGHIDVEVKDGVVTLRGQVHDDRAKKKAEKLAKKEKGVKKVVNELKVAPK